MASAMPGQSLPSRGAWIEITREEMATMGVASLPSRGAWIEIRIGPLHNMWGTGRSPHGERGLKFQPRIDAVDVKSRSPHGERGLKSDVPGP